MGGKVWSDREERYFWRSAMSYSAKRVGVDRAKPERSWAELAMSMQRALGGHARRTYTGTMLFEHYFQNIESQRRSPNAALYVRDYLRKGGSFRDPLARRSAASRRRAIQANNRVNPPVTSAPSPAAGIASQAENDASSTVRQAPDVAVSDSPPSQLQPAVGSLQPGDRLTKESLEAVDPIDPDETESE